MNKLRLSISLCLLIFSLFSTIGCSSTESNLDTTNAGVLSSFPEPGYIIFTYEDFTTTGGAEIYIGHAGNDKITNLTNDPASDSQPVWTTKNSQIAFTSNRDGERMLYTMNLDGNNVQQLTTEKMSSFAWSPTGSQLAFASNSANYLADIFIQNSDGSIQQLMDTPESESLPAWSPDASRVVYSCSNGQTLCIVTLENSEFQILQKTREGEFFWQTNLASRRGLDWVTVLDIDWAPEGEKIAVILNYGASEDKQLCIVDAITANMDCIVNGAELDSLSWSPDGGEIVYIDNDIFVIDIASGDAVQITSFPDSVRISHIDWFSE